jgi:hypothetical protein
MTVLQYTYATLAAAMQNWPEDDDTDYVAAIPELIGHGELKLTRELDLEIFEVDVTTPIVTTVATIAKPTNMVAPRTLAYTNGGTYVELDQRTVDFVRQHGAVAPAGNPKYYAELSETQWIASPTPNFNGTLNARIIRRPAGLVVLTPTSTSFLSLYFPDLLLKSCLIAAHTYLKNDPKYAQMVADYGRSLPMAASEVGVLRKKNAIARQTLEGITQFNAPPAEDQAQT